MPVEDFDHLGEVGEVAGQAVDLVDDDYIDLSTGDVGEELLQTGALHAAAGIAAVVVARRHRGPALTRLAHDVGLAGFALRVQAIEALIQTFFRRLPGVDRAAQPRHGRCDLVIPGHTARLFFSSLRPKKRGSDQRAPVIARATSDRLA